MVWNHRELPNNEYESLRRLESLTRRQQRNGQTEAYNEVIREQITANIIEKVPKEVKRKEFYVPHKAVVRETSAITKLRIVYDALARASPQAPIA